MMGESSGGNSTRIVHVYNMHAMCLLKVIPANLQTSTKALVNQLEPVFFPSLLKLLVELLTKYSIWYGSLFSSAISLEKKNIDNVVRKKRFIHPQHFCQYFVCNQPI